MIAPKGQMIYTAAGCKQQFIVSILAAWQEKYKKGVIYYLDEGKVKGVLLWNVWGALDAARQVIKDTHNNPVDPGDLPGRISSSG